ncbi:DUF6691 family protein [Haliea salexigens]|uniref:DUF6691 family protein n=1 Tax=Haliea salexigens TaxID=287487 RepID=UPI00040F1AD3|nr:DUF6691 family protein [Haliea salexigens]|tara:strand:- start:6656 stop:7078 length:423 start_codon:yes stop_codon:yes gene_type:complete
MKSALTAMIAGLLFGSGLIVSGMVNPAKVLGFLDLTGQWDPSLGLVMASAIVLSWVGVKLAARRSDPACPVDPPAKPIDKPLVLGSIMFGIGWGLSGFCPGPAVVAASDWYWPALAVMAGLLPGLAVAGAFQARERNSAG